jgi:hypothetical protein
VRESGTIDDAVRLHDGGAAAGPEALQAGLEALVGLPCWSASVGPKASIAMDLGEKLQRVQALKNPQLSEAQRRFIGEHWLLVQCAWRVEGAEGVVCASGDVSNIAAGVASLVGRTITAVELRTPALDLVLSFGTERRLSIFRDRSDGDGESYTLAIPGETIGVLARGGIEREPRAMPPQPD